jgi:hypothetical protein
VDLGVILQGSLMSSSTAPMTLLRTCINMEKDRLASWLASMAPTRSSLLPLSTSPIFCAAMRSSLLTLPTASFMLCANEKPEASCAELGGRRDAGAQGARVVAQCCQIGLDQTCEFIAHLALYFQYAVTYQSEILVLPCQRKAIILPPARPDSLGPSVLSVATPSAASSRNKSSKPAPTRFTWP